MPRKKRTGGTEANIQPATKSSPAEESADSVSEKAVEEPSVMNSAEITPPQIIGQSPPDHYICMDRPLFDFEEEARDGSEVEDDEGLEAAFNAYQEAQEGSRKMWPKPVSEHPDWKGIINVESYKMYLNLRRDQNFVYPDNFVNPDIFDMHVYNDFHAYGIHSCLEDLVEKSSKENSKKKDRSLQHMWGIMTAIGWWLNEEEIRSVWEGIDDGYRLAEFVDIIGCALLCILEEVDHADELKPESKFRDLGMVMSLHLQWSVKTETDSEPGEWEEAVVAYAKKGGIDLVASGCHGTETALVEAWGVEPLEDKPLGRWKWGVNYKKYKTKFGLVTDSIPFLLPYYEITKWTRHLRAKYTFEHVDPLADIPERELKAGNLPIWQVGVRYSEGGDVGAFYMYL